METIGPSQFVDAADLLTMKLVPLSAIPEDPPCCNETRERNYRRGYYDGWMSAMSQLEDVLPPEVNDQLWLFLRAKLLPWKRAANKPEKNQPWMPPRFHPERIRNGNGPGIVYLLQAEGTPSIKIGRTSTRKQRIQALRTASPIPLRLLREIITAHAAALEKALHTRYALYRQQGEWFDLPEEKLQALLAEPFE
jgi:Meiotically up-regulated gene 113